MKTKPSVSLERIVLALGLASSLCLAIAAFAAFGDAREAGWSHLNDLSARARDNVRAAWSALTRVDETRPGDAVCLSPASDVVVLWSTHAGPPHFPPVPLRPAPFAAASLFEVLMSESERAEFSKHDLSEAYSLALEASSKDVPPEHAAQARLRAIQLAARSGRAADVRAQWSAAENSIDAHVATGETSTLLLCLLAALPSFDPDQRVAIAQHVVELWTPTYAPSLLVLPNSNAHIACTGAGPAARFEWSPDPRELALRERLLEACGRPAAWIKGFEALDTGEEQIAFATLVNPANRMQLEGESWTLYPALGEFLAARSKSWDAEGHFVLRSVVEKALHSVLTDRNALPAEFVLDLGGDDTQLGEAVGPPLDLGPAYPRVALRHPDVASILRQVAARTLWLRAGLIVLALFVAGAACTTFFALRRERRLADARTAFVANVSHELRTPLASILLMAENLDSGRSGDNAPRYYSTLKREALRLRRLVEDVLDFSRLERGQRFQARMDDVDVAAWFDALCADAAALGAPSKLDVRCSRAELPAQALFDREALRRAALNLVDNALRHSHSDAVALHLGLRGDGLLALSVSDAGRGIPPGQRQAVFEPFTRLNGTESTPGAGLGLAIVREIAEAHGGHVVVHDPATGPGAVFEITIPVGGQTVRRMEAHT